MSAIGRNANQEVKDVMKLLVASMFPTHPTTVGNRARIRRLCSALQEMNHEVHFAFIPREDGDLKQMSAFFGEQRLHKTDFKPAFREKNLLSKLIRRFLAIFEHQRAYVYKVDDWYPPSLDVFFQDLAIQHKFDAVIVEYVFLSRALQFFSDDTLKIIDTHDRFSDRHEMFLAAGQWPGWFSTTLDEETKGLKRADAILAIQDKEREFFSKYLPDRQVATVGHMISVTAPVTDWEHRVKYSILMVGSDNPPNRTALNWFLKDILPTVRKTIDEACLLLAGDICNSVDDHPNVIKLGIVDDIASAHAQAWIAINPVLNGTGLSIKAVEALGYGLPLVATTTGSRGLEEYIGRGIVQTPDHDSESISNAIITLLLDSSERERMSSEAYNFAKEWNGSATSQLKEILLKGKRFT